MSDVTCNGCGAVLDQSDMCSHECPENTLERDVGILMEGVTNLWLAVRDLQRRVAALEPAKDGADREPK